MCHAVLVIPCFNEAGRLDMAAFSSFLRATPGVDLLFVDDGSRDKTAGVLGRLCAEAEGRASLLALPQNAGKAEAVRQGLLAALPRRTPFVGYWDADLSTPLEAVSLFLAEAEARPHLEMILGARVQLLGRTIERLAWRHYTGRVFATVVSIMLRLAVYDTQCGAKLLRTTGRLPAILAEPFISRWAFDVEILARLGLALARAGGPPLEDVVMELPLPVWRHVPGSKIHVWDAGAVVRDLARIGWWLRRERRRGVTS